MFIPTSLGKAGELFHSGGIWERLASHCFLCLTRDYLSKACLASFWFLPCSELWDFPGVL